MRTTKPKARIEDTPLEVWHRWFKEKTGLIPMSQISLVSTATIAKFRRKLGYDHWPRGGDAFRIYTRADAEAIARLKTGGKSLKKASREAGIGYCAAKTLAMRYRDLLPSKHQK